MELERHIEILLLDNDCVIVPGLGGFMTHYAPAYYDESDGMFLPPQRTLGFNPQLKINDSLLAQSYVDAYDISYPDALRRIESEVAELLQYLDNEGCYELNDIGVLRRNDDGRLTFAPCEAGILTPELYGLGSFEMSVLEQKAEKQVTKAERATVVTIGNVNSDIDAVHEDEAESTEDTAFVIKMSWVRNAVAVAAAIAAILLFTTPIADSGDEAGQYVSGFNNPLLPQTTLNDTNMTPIVVEKNDTMVEVEPAAVEEKVDTVAEEKAEDRYVIVLACYVTKRNARDFIELLNKKGYTEAEVYVRNNVTRVVYGNYPTEQAAYNMLRQLRQNEETQDAWVMHIDA